jgi:type IV secretion system protein VirB4
LIDDAAERAWAAEWIANILARETIVVTPEAKDHLWSALTSLASAPVGERTLTGLSVLLQSQMLKRALQPYCLGGPFGHLLDAEAERLGEAEVQAFETEGLIGTSAAPAVLAYLFHCIEARLDGRPTLLIVDEGWLALDDQGFAGQLREWLKTLRKKNASVIFATQSLSDIDGSAIAPAIIESCPTRLFLPNERAIEPQITAIYRRFGLNDRQIEILARATPKRDYYCQSRRGNRLFELGLGPVALALCGSSAPDDQRLIDRCVSEGEPIGFPARFLSAKGLAWASELIERWPNRLIAPPIPQSPTRIDPAEGVPAASAAPPDSRPPSPKAAARTIVPRTDVPPLPGLPGGPPMPERLSPFRIASDKIKRSRR